MAAVHRLERLGSVALVVLDEPGRPINTLGTAGIHDFEHLLDLLESDHELTGIVVVSAKPTTWLAGADLDELGQLGDPAQAQGWAERGQSVLRRWHDLRIPTVAAIQGAALGGGCEVALACRFRIAADHPATTLGLPEVQLGLIPALGGTHRLPRAVGLARGVRMLLSGERLSAAEALRAGLVDEVVPPQILLRAALARVARGGRRHRRRRRFGEWLLEGNPLGRAVLFAGARRQMERQTGGHYPAPPAILAAAQAGAAGDGRAGERLEAAAFGTLATSTASRNLVRLFLATRELAADGKGAARGQAAGAAAGAAGGKLRPPAPVAQVGIAGAGFMGSGIAAAAARAGCRVRLLDAAPEALARGMAFCGGRFTSLAKRRKLSREAARIAFARIAPTLELRGFARCELVVEAVVEDLAVKKPLLAELERQLAPTAILASNTSTLPIAELARELAHPERVLGLHFFSPVHRMPLVEIIRHPGTGDEPIARALGFVRALGKTPIVVRDGPGFYTSRILSPYLAEAGALLAAGATVEEIDAAGRAAGFPVGPLALLDEVGIDIAARAARTLAEAFGARMPYPESFGKLVEAGRLGRKSRRGFYDYRGKTKRPDPETLAILGVTSRPGQLEPSELADRLLLAMVAEAVRCLEEGILAAPRDGDVGAVLGLGFPPFHGGPFRYLDALGAAEALRRLEALAATAGPRFDPPELLRAKAASGETFHG